MDGAPVAETARAKLNLDLLVLGRRPDGYHELDSIVVAAEVGDRLTFRDAPDLRLRLDGPFAASLSEGDDNLVLRAARGLAVALEEPRGALIQLDKRLPVAAGIGGGSADAAATLRGLCRLWGRTPPAADLADLALGLGSDVPACLAHHPVRMRGRGERLAPVADLPALPVVLVNPLQAVPTGAVFAGLDPRHFRERRPDLLPRCPDLASVAAWLGAGTNALERSATALVPAVGEVLQALRGAPGCLLARMSGSGATCFGLFASAAAATAASARLERGRAGWWVVACATLPSPAPGPTPLPRHHGQD